MMMNEKEDEHQTTTQGFEDDEESLLLPTKVYSSGDSSCVNVKAYRETDPRWESQTVLDWLESLVVATETGELEDMRVGNERLDQPPKPITIDGVCLGKRIERPAIIAASSCYEQLRSQQQNPPVSIVCAKEGRAAGITPKLLVPTKWNLSFLDIDPYSEYFIPEMLSLGSQIESYSLSVCIRNRYRIVQQQLEFIFNRIMSHCPDRAPNGYGEIRSMLDKLYIKTVDKLQDILDHTSRSMEKKSFHEAHGDEVQIMIDNECDHNKRNEYGTPTRPIKQEEESILLQNSYAVSKPSLVTFMTSWLRKNFIHPFPDERCIPELALACNSTPTQVSNWLINQRTRKWRPSIEKAFALDRPYHLLLHDAVHIFDGKPLCDLPPVTVFDLSGGVVRPSLPPASPAPAYAMKQSKRRERNTKEGRGEGHIAT